MNDKKSLERRIYRQREVLRKIVDGGNPIQVLEAEIEEQHKKYNEKMELIRKMGEIIEEKNKTIKFLEEVIRANHTT
jgi:hypothetical protein